MHMALSIINYEAEVRFSKLPIIKKNFSINCARGRGKTELVLYSFYEIFF